MLEWNLFKTHIFSMRHIATFPPLGTLESMLALCWGGILNSLINKKSTSNVKTQHKIIHKKDSYLLCESWNRKVEGCFVQPQQGICMLRDSKLLLLCTHPSVNCTTSTIGGLQVDFSEQTNSQIQTPWKMQINYRFEASMCPFLQKKSAGIFIETETYLQINLGKYKSS